ncbi:DUF1476 domain-containing protein [Lichenibacterium dinghuense]|uniref:DUF1476 domain-containing protein n=1 Tax=Lichenibacterium dinghuense TaxID=2895977 RepID=UPI001F25B254|nr:DUF1476 domain-containing protein [Lichenibacterium sp. 6Y81]
MTTFDDRERAFENLFAHDQDLAFRAQARRNRELGLWAAHQLGLSGDEAEAYAGRLLAVAIENGGDDAVAARLGEDLNKHGLGISEHRIRHRMAELLAESVEHVKRD